MGLSQNIFLYLMRMIVVCLMLQQFAFIFYQVDAKSYAQSSVYGGDLNSPKSDDPVYSRRYGQQQQQQPLQQQQQPYGQSYGNDYAQQQPGRQQQQQYGNLRNQDERQVYGNNPNQKNAARNRWQGAAANVRDDGQYGPEYRNQKQYTYSSNKSNKCDIWIPDEAMDKYPKAIVMKVDSQRRLKNIQVCCPGFGSMNDNTLCLPVCDNCRNGVCVAPNVCQCYDEFVQNDNGDCVFTCPMGCLNGRCYLDGSCQCDPGYKLDETRKFCRPICSKGCGISPLHNCTEPEVCGCIKGYTLTDDDCQPVCQPECGIGGMCRKADCGFDGIRDAKNNPILCGKPNVCDCLAGYTLKDDVCQSDCYQKCDNGVCYSRNRCICNPGFQYHERSTQCIPQ